MCMTRYEIQQQFKRGCKGQNRQIIGTFSSIESRPCLVNLTLTRLSDCPNKDILDPSFLPEILISEKERAGRGILFFSCRLYARLYAYIRITSIYYYCVRRRPLPHLGTRGRRRTLLYIRHRCAPSSIITCVKLTFLF